MFDVIMPIAKQDLAVALENIPYIRRNLDVRKLIIISKNEIKQSIPNKAWIDFIDEDQVLDGMTFGRIKEILIQRGATGRRAGWYFQQFIKMAYCYCCQDQIYVSFDADSLPLRRIEYYNNRHELYFNLRDEYNPLYFQTLKNLIGYDRVAPKSFISEHMFFECCYMRELIEKIMNNSALEGRTFYEKILHAVPEAGLEGSGFSEFETYGTFIMKEHPEGHTYRELRTFRAGKRLLEKNEAVLEWFGKTYDIVAFEKWERPTLMCKIWSCDRMREKYTADEAVDIFNKWKGNIVFKIANRIGRVIFKY